VTQCTEVPWRRLQKRVRYCKQVHEMTLPSPLKLVLAGALSFSAPALAADLAVLHNGFTIRHESRQQVGSITRLFLETGFVDVPSISIDHFEKDLTPAAAAPLAASSSITTSAAPVLPMAAPALPKTPLRLDQLVSDASGRNQLDPDLVNSVIHAESGFNPRAVSPKGARGLMQLMPQTASRLGVRNAFDPKANVEGGTLYLRTLLEQYNFDVVKALAAYNAGPQRVARYKGVPPYYETQAYVARIIRDFNRKKLAEQKAAAIAAKAASRRTQTAEAAPAPGSGLPVSR
jgi:soluble lytic murein transglycosylase-like protein